jgi:hypothetical protein
MHHMSWTRRFTPALASAALVAGLAFPGLGQAADVATLQAQIQALSARLAKLETPAYTAADLAGSYAVTGFQSELHGTGGDWQVRSYVYDGTITLKVDGKYTKKIAETGSQIVGSGGGVFASFFSQDDPGRGKWKVKGNTVDLDGLKLYIVGTGELLVGSSANPDDNTNVILLLTRLPSAQ